MKKTSSLRVKLQQFSMIDWLLLLFFVATCILDVSIVFHTSLHMLDSDAASELVLAKHLSDTGRLISTDWYYSTELYFFNTHLVFAPLFRIFSTWRHVRFFGVLILQGLLLLAYWYLCKAAKLNHRAYLFGGALLLLPLSVAYARIILYHSYYAMNMVISFLLVALFLSLYRDLEEKRSRLSFIIHLLLWLLLSLCSGINGFRQICITHLPMVMVLVVVLIKPNKDSDPKPKHYWLCVLLMILCSAAFLGGYLINGQLSRNYAFAKYELARIQLKSIELLKDTLFGYLHMFGYRRGVLLISTAGILSLLGLLAGGIVTAYSGKLLIGKEHEQSFGARFLTLLFPCAMIVYVLVLLIVNSVGWPTLYINCFFPLFFPAVGALITYPMPERSNRYCHPNKVLSCFVIVVMIANSVFNAFYFHQPKKYVQDYEGLSWWDIHTVSEMEPLRAKLVDNGYDIGYCTHWFGNVLTEMSNGKLEIVSLNVNEEGIQYRPWLTEKRLVHVVPEKPFLIVHRTEVPFLETTDIYSHCRLLVEEVDYFAYELDDPMVMYNLLHSKK